MYLGFALVIVILGWKVQWIAAPEQTGASRRISAERRPGRSSRHQALRSWAPIFASLVAAGGLIFTAFSVRYQAEQTGLQVAASRAQADLQNKQQAQLINTWTSDQSSPDAILVTVSNRSEEPIYQFRFYIAFATPGSGRYLAISTWTSFPPCREITFDLQSIAESYAQTARLMPPNGTGAFDYGLIFEDAGGQTWHRHASGMLHATPWLEYLSEPRTGSFLPPQIFQSFTPLMTDNFTAPKEGGKFIFGGLVIADNCGQGT